MPRAYRTHVRFLLPKNHRAGNGGLVTVVRVERAELDSGTAVMYRDFGQVVRLAHDPDQIEEAAALALLCLRVPRLVGNMQIQHVR